MSNKFWTPELVAKAIELYKTKDRYQIAEILGCPPNSVKHILGLHKVYKRTPAAWSRKDQQTLIEMYAKYPLQITAKKLRRSRSSIKKMADYLGLTRETMRNKQQKRKPYCIDRGEVTPEVLVIAPGHVRYAMKHSGKGGQKHSHRPFQGGTTLGYV
jgi:hypothetical protein